MEEMADGGGRSRAGADGPRASPSPPVTATAHGSAPSQGRGRADGHCRGAGAGPPACGERPRCRPLARITSMPTATACATTTAPRQAAADLSTRTATASATPAATPTRVALATSMPTVTVCATRAARVAAQAVGHFVDANGDGVCDNPRSRLRPWPRRRVWRRLRRRGWRRRVRPLRHRAGAAARVTETARATGAGSGNGKRRRLWQWRGQRLRRRQRRWPPWRRPSRLALTFHLVLGPAKDRPELDYWTGGLRSSQGHRRGADLARRRGMARLASCGAPRQEDAPGRAAGDVLEVRAARGPVQRRRARQSLAFCALPSTAASIERAPGVHPREPRSTRSGRQASTWPSRTRAAWCARFWGAMHDLGDPPRTAVYLALYEGYTAPEIARMLDVPVNTVYSWISRGRKILQEVLSA